jgi:hypothetical protein
MDWLITSYLADIPMSLEIHDEIDFVMACLIVNNSRLGVLNCDTALI